MEPLLKASLASLAKELEFSVEKVTPLDVYYTDGTAQGSFLKLKIHTKESITTVYLYESGKYVSTGTLSEEDRRILEDWIHHAYAKKIEHDRIRSEHHLKH